jgi:hypothetical protein
MYRRPIVWAEIALLVGCVGVSHGADSPIARSWDPVAATIIAAVPTGWTCDRGPGKIVVRRIDEPVIVNLRQAERHKSGETWDHWARKHTVNIKYRIVVRFVTKIDPDHVRRMREENRKIQREIDKLGQVVPQGMDWTPEQKERRKNYEKLAKSLNQIPHGHLGEVSVYIEPTNLGYAQFLSKDIAAESKMVIERIANALTPYASEPEQVP